MSTSHEQALSGLSLEDKLVVAGLLSEAQLELARREQQRKGGVLRRILVELGFVSPDRLSEFVAREADAGSVNLNEMAIDKTAVELVPLAMLRRFRALPISRTEGSVTVAMADPLDITAIDAFRQVTGVEIDVVAAPERDILNFLDTIETPMESILDSIDRGIAERTTELVLVADAEAASLTESDAPVINLVSQVISRAVSNGASDIHFEPEEKLMRIRTRMDGLLHPDLMIPKALQSAVIARMKILADMDVSETRVPQDGRASVFVQRRQINLRVSSLPTSYGESVVVRILDAGSHILKLSMLGFAPDIEASVRTALDAPYGVIIVTGPTGSGKTTTLYSVLNEISSPDLSIFTLEDPVELRIQGFRQTQIRDDIGLTFSAGLRSLLRQDPDIILVGETRDSETAQLMVRAALTGHLVFTTLHTNDAAGAVPRLVDMGVEPYLLPSSLLAVMAQRLVRKLCERCRRPIAEPLKEFERLAVPCEGHETMPLWREGGCPVCSNSGLKGRRPVFEWMPVDNDFNDLIVGRHGAPEIAAMARKKGMRSMYEDGLRLCGLGATTLAEVLRATRSGEH